MLKSHFFNFLKKTRILKSHFLIFWVFHRLWKSANPKKLKRSQSSQPSVSESFGDPCYYYKGAPRNCQVIPRVCVTLWGLAQPSLTFGRLRAKVTSWEHLNPIYLMILKVFHNSQQNCGKPCDTSVRIMVQGYYPILSSSIIMYSKSTQVIVWHF